ncbi:hypothetical protein LC608_04845 [Nostoc sp. XA010]|uniref:hypothetical protein n=1 Tax=Nostoc sp. XA010 TaxID=2780407 RepID=UPI001E2999B6|nr:hypothetical protein [Nostoc sp. XA010]MCC5656322.1 hypothetical protein [Nostoc sp. XA010]
MSGIPLLGLKSRIGDRLYVTDKRFDRFVLAIALWENGLLWLTFESKRESSEVG